MKILRILNNNVVEARNSQDESVIIIGRGIGHEKRRGDEVEVSDADEIFLMTNKSLFPSVQNLLTSVSTDLIETSNKIVNYGKRRLPHELNQNIIITLTDHLDYAIARARDGFSTPNPLNWDIKRFYPREYEIGLYALQIVKKYQFTTLSKDEAGFIAMHFVDASLEGNQPHNVTQLTQMIKTVLTVVDALIHNIDTESVAYSRFVRHIQYMAMRLLDFQGSTEHADDEIMSLVFKKNPDAYAIAKRVGDQLTQDYQVSLNDAELMYMTLHISRLLNTNGE
ncbi:PRD domain-containing protein [Lacticaseibacillus suibinensis]|uniref:PRD domain-containing protein n=1 Tax=Lacticaseibacillus suibinensis TaxID=2486011 RepID=UPI000F7A1C96|nr:PRD domain-containing protein [Lacticaseibacillus suibinensis]